MSDQQPSPLSDGDKLTIDATLYDLEHPGEISTDPDFDSTTDELEDFKAMLSRVPTQPLLNLDEEDIP